VTNAWLVLRKESGGYDSSVGVLCCGIRAALRAVARLRVDGPVDGVRGSCDLLQVDGLERGVLECK